MLTLISDKAKRQETLFDDSLQRSQSAKLMAAIDAINAEFGRDTVTTSGRRCGQKTVPLGSLRDGTSYRLLSEGCSHRIELLG